MRPAHRHRDGFTLVELLVVLGILALLSSLVIVKLGDLSARTRSATQAYSLADTSRQVEIYYGLNNEYPCGWDSLQSADGTIAAYSPMKPMLSPSLAGPGRTILNTSTTVLTADQIKSLNAAGIYMLMLHDVTLSGMTPAVPPSDSGTTMNMIAPGMMGIDNVLTLNVTLTEGPPVVYSEGLSLLLRDFGLNPMRTDPTTVAALPSRIANSLYVVVGLGRKCMLVSHTIVEAPFFDQADSDKYYSRALGIFEVPLTGGAPAKFIGLIGPDGRTKDMSASDYRSHDGM
jgi:prepilin-type N-terminal cleavage/methylation domain-containing protein